VIELYHAAGSVCAKKARICLAEKGITDWVGHELHLERADQTQPEYLKLNPKGVVPTLVHDGRIITESTVICEYLEDAFSRPPLRPKDPVDAAMMRKWAKIPDEEIHFACSAISSAGLLGRARRKNPEEFERRLAGMPDRVRAGLVRARSIQRWDHPDIRAAVLVHDKLLKNMESELAKNGPWLVGDIYTLADIGITPYVHRLHEMKFHGMWAHRPHVAHWLRRIMARPSFAAAITKFPPRYDKDYDAEEDAKDWAAVKKILEAA
jgi:glutathione S-transferase